MSISVEEVDNRRFDVAIDEAALASALAKSSKSRLRSSGARSVLDFQGASCR